MKKKLRADELLLQKNALPSRSRAQALIMAGSVRYRLKPDDDWKLLEKAGLQLEEHAEFEVDDPHNKDVGRGAQKMRGAFEAWPELVMIAQGAQALDVGSSTGGFTQVLLEKGVERVVALDVGTNQLHERLRADPRVVVAEQQHVLHIDEAFWQKIGVQPPFGFVVSDLSFISVTKVIPKVAPWIKHGGAWVMLVKPQFELEPRKVPKGIVKDEAHRKEAIAKVRAIIQQTEGLRECGLVESPITGGDGNREYLLCVSKD